VDSGDRRGGSTHDRGSDYRGGRDWDRGHAWYGGRSYSGYRGYGYGLGFGVYGPRYSYGYYPGYYPSYGYYDGYGAGYPYYGTGYGYYGSSSAANGLVLGALAGGIIGNNSGAFGHKGLRGAAWGAGAGWLLGAVADANRRTSYQTAPVVVQATAPQVQAQAAPAQPPQQITIINNYYSTPMSGANSLFGR
jgi:hypothetical protein